MMRAALSLAIALTGCSTHLTNLELGDPLPPHTNPTGELLMISPGQMAPRHLWVRDGVEYSIAADRAGSVQYIATKSTDASTPEGVRVGQQLVHVLKIEHAVVVMWPGWGYVVELPSGWKAALHVDGEYLERGPTNSDRVVLLFKGTAAGYGA